MFMFARILKILGLLILLLALFLAISAAPFFRFFLHPVRLLGLFEGERTYLVLLQNNYELRPTGGFITAFATLTLRNGIPQNLTFEDVYGAIDDHEYVTPPFPLGELLADPNYRGHSFRDANVNPDFPSTIRDTLAFYRKTRPFQVFDGVMAVDFALFEKWLRLTGPIEVNGTKWTREHFFEILTHMVSDIDLHNPEEAKERKFQFQTLLKALVKKTLLPWNALRFGFHISELLEEKHILLFFEDPALQSLVTKKGWGGEMKYKEGEDFLAIVDANYGGLKSNRYLTREIFYRIDLEGGESHLEISYRHPGEYNIPLSGDYKGYLRAYVPQSHQPILGENVIVSEEEKFSIAGALVKVPIRSSLTKAFSFRFPKSNFREPSYTLVIRKQPGTFADFYRVTIRIPQGMRISSSDFRPLENIALFEGFLETDRRLTLTFEKDELPPRPILQGLKKLNEFVVMWNEPIDPNSVKKESFRFADTNKTKPVTDDLRIESIAYEGSTLRLKTSGMTNQPEEHYLLKISGVSDFHGNPISERTYTFVQRLE